MDKKTEQEFVAISRLFNTGKIRQAKAAVEQSLRRHPRAFFLHNIHGAIDGTMGNWEEARKHFQKAVKLNPKSYEALRNLGNANRALGDLNGAQKHLIKALQVNRRFATGWCSLGNVYLDKGNIEKALDAYRKALHIQPQFPEAAVNLMTQLDRSNRIGAFREAVDAVAKTMPEHPAVTLYQGLLLERDGAFEAAKEKLDSVSFDPSKTPGDANLELTRLNRLAKINDRLQNTQAAYGQFIEANALNAAKLAAPFVSADRFWSGLEARLSYYQPGFGTRWKVQAKTTESPVFMVGFPRSGTTLLDTFLRGHADVEVIEEQPLVYEMRKDLGVEKEFDFSGLDTLTERQLDSVAKAYLRRQRAGRAAPVIIDKLPLNLSYAGEILRVFPKAKFIVSLRDPADAVFSAFMQSFKLNDAMATFDTPKNAARTYDQSFRIWEQVSAELAPAMITIKYEDLVADQKAALQPVTSFLGVEWDEAVLDHQKTAQTRTHIATSSYAQVVQPIYKTALARWERYAPLMPDALEILAPWRKEFGYSD